jgi:uncharacterized membrane protein YedE/YeeE
MTITVYGLAFGFIFGMMLEKSRVFEPRIIVRQLELKNFIMIKVFLTAILVGSRSIYAMQEMGYISGLKLKPVFIEANIIGGLLLGVGLVFAGGCPGTVFAQLGVGYKDAYYTFVGAAVGVIAYSYFSKAGLSQWFFREKGHTLTMDQVLGVDSGFLIVVRALAIIAILIWLEKKFPTDREMGKNYCGN